MRSITKKRSLTFIAITLFALLILSLSFAVRSSTGAGAAADPGHQVLPANDGWAAASGGTTGGSTATAAHVYTATTRAQLVQDLGEPKAPIQLRRLSTSRVPSMVTRIAPEKR